MEVWNSLALARAVRSGVLPAALACTGLAAPAAAVPVVMTGGSIAMETTTPAPFSDVFVSLLGAAFELSNHFLHDSFSFTGAPHPAALLLVPGTEVDFDGFVSLVSPLDRLTFEGVTYLASGQIHVDTARILVGNLVSLPFTLSGAVHGDGLLGPETVDVSIMGSGIVRAEFREVMGGAMLELDRITYEVTPIPEPASLTLLGAGLTSLGAWSVARRRRRPR